MKFNIRIAIFNTLLVLAGVVVSACNKQKEGPETTLEERVDSFANAYFNWQFFKAINHVTPESEKWMRYAASQVHPADLKLINEQEEKASVEIDDIELTNDTSAKVKISVSNYMRMDTIGNAGRMIDEAKFILYARYRTDKKKWMMHLTDLPRHEK